MDRLILRTGQASIEVDSLEAGHGPAAPAGAAGRRLRRQHRRAERPGPGAAGHSEIKVPSARFDELTAGLEPIGRLEFVNVSAEDVSEEFVDLAARAANGRRLEERLVELAPDPYREAAGRPFGRAGAREGAGGDRADRGPAALSQDQRRAQHALGEPARADAHRRDARGAVRSPRRSGRHGATSWGCSRRRSRPSGIWCRSSCSAGAWSRSGEGGGDRRRRKREERKGKREAGSPRFPFHFSVFPLYC